MRIRWIWAFVDLPAADFETAVAFWSAVTGSRPSPARGESGQFLTLVPGVGAAWVKAQRLADGPGRIHLDLDVDGSLPAAARTAVALGAEVLTTYDDVIVCRSRGGMHFCLTAYDAAGSDAGADRIGRPSVLDQVCLDIPPDRYDAERAFWTELTGWPADPLPAYPEFERLRGPVDLPLRLLLQRLDTPAASVSAHLEVAAADRPAEAARHVALGATVEADGPDWIVLRDPAGLRYCVIPPRA